MLNTYETPKQWHKINAEALTKYFNNFGIEFEVMDLNNPLVDSFIKIEKAVKIPIDKRLSWNGEPSFQSALRKIIRLYRCLESDHKNYIFVDLDTIVLKTKQNILDLHENKLNYASHGLKPRDLNAWTFYSHKFIEHAYGSTNKNNFLYLDSGFTIFTKDFCYDCVEFLDKNNFSPMRLESLQNLINISSETIDYIRNKSNFGASGKHFHDEHVFSLFLNSKECSYRESLRGVMGRGMCSTFYNYVEYSKLTAGEIISAARKQDCVFHHFLGAYSDKTLNEISLEVAKNEK